MMIIRKFVLYGFSFLLIYLCVAIVNQTDNRFAKGTPTLNSNEDNIQTRSGNSKSCTETFGCFGRRMENNRDTSSYSKYDTIPNTTLHGRGSFKWIAGGAFLMWQSEIDEVGVPSGIAIFGSDDSTGDYFMLYFDERKVSRKYEVSVCDNIIKWWRNAPGFSQRYTWTIANDGHTIIGKGELSKDGTNWEGDLELTFTRTK